MNTGDRALMWSIFVCMLAMFLLNQWQIQYSTEYAVSIVKRVCAADGPKIEGKP